MSRLELVFFVGSVDGSSVRVASWTDAVEDVREQLVDELAHLAETRRPGAPAEEAGAEDRDAEDLWARIDARHAALTTRPWEHVRLGVDGQERAAEVLRDGDAWVALCGVDGVAVTVAGDAVPLGGLALARVRDVEPYVAGLHELRTG